MCVCLLWTQTGARAACYLPDQEAGDYVAQQVFAEVSEGAR